MKIDYPYLPEGRTIKYVPAGNTFMKVAEEVAHTMSSDKQHPTSAVLVMDGKVILKAANQSALKNPLLLKLHKKGLCVRKILKIKSGQKYWLCLGCASSHNHAETLLIKQAENLGIKTEGGDIYHWGHWWCCEPCWNSMIRGGVRDLYLLEGSEVLFNPKAVGNIIGK